MAGFQQFIAFAQTARTGGFAAAARALGVAPSTVAKSVLRLEESLGVKLFHRTTRQVQLTPDGMRLFERCERVLAEIEALQADASGSSASLSGTLRIDLPVFYGRHFVMPLLASLCRQHPQLRLDVSFTDQQVDLVRQGIDLAVRVGHLRDSSLVARRVDRQSLVLCASSGYLAAHGRPRNLGDLARHQAIVFRLPTSGRDRPWQFRRAGQPLEYQPMAAVRVNETEALADAARAGLGLCQLPAMIVQDDLAQGQIVEVLPALRPQPLPIQLVYPSGRLLPARVRAAMDVLAALGQRVEI